MSFLMNFPYYVRWHYGRGFREWVANLRTFIVFEFNFFSIDELLRTLFKPFHRLKERYSGSPLDFEQILSVWVINILMRIVGLVVRTFLIILGSIVIGVSLVVAIMLSVAWLVLPLLVIGILIISMQV